MLTFGERNTTMLNVQRQANSFGGSQSVEMSMYSEALQRVEKRLFILQQSQKIKKA